jgi:hypothetical protein
MLAGLTKRPLTFRGIFSVRLRFVTWKNVLCVPFDLVQSVSPPFGVCVLQLSNS